MKKIGRLVIMTEREYKELMLRNKSKILLSQKQIEKIKNLLKKKDNELSNYKISENLNEAVAEEINFDC